MKIEDFQLWALFCFVSIFNVCIYMINTTKYLGSLIETTFWDVNVHTMNEENNIHFEEIIWATHINMIIMLSTEAV